MSTQRRRVLEGDGGITTITDDGVYIEGLNGKFYTVDDWQSGNDANSIIVVSSSIKFRMALTEPSEMAISSATTDPLENYMTAISSSTEAILDYDGAGNTAKILQMQPSTSYAAGYCNAFTFPDGKTKGFLPSLGQLNLVYQNKAVVDAALSKCGGTAMNTTNYYWSSTFYGVGRSYRYCWGLHWSGGYVNYFRSYSGYYVRPFADIS